MIRARRAAAIIAISLAITGCARIVKNAEYRRLIDDFCRAQSRAPGPVDGQSTPGWDFELKLADSSTVAAIRALVLPGAVTIHYADEKEPRPLYKYVDYSTPGAIRVGGNVLYVYWGETLISSTNWLIAYDWVNRREIERRRVDASDLCHP